MGVLKIVFSSTRGGREIDVIFLKNNLTMCVQHMKEHPSRSIEEHSCP